MNLNFNKKTDGCLIGGALSVIFSDIYMTKTKQEVAKPINPRFYERFVHNVINKRKKDRTDSLFENLHNDHPNTKYTIDTNGSEVP